jgi:hypothetical protein
VLEYFTAAGDTRILIIEDKPSFRTIFLDDDEPIRIQRLLGPFKQAHQILVSQVVGHPLDPHTVIPPLKPKPLHARIVKVLDSGLVLE